MQVFHVGMEEPVQHRTTTTLVRVQMDSQDRTVNKVQYEFVFHYFAFGCISYEFA